MVVGVAGTNPAGGLDVCPLHVVLSCVGRGLCDELIPRPKDPTPCLIRFRNPKRDIGKSR
jgi:hypothetical protein